MNQKKYLKNGQVCKGINFVRQIAKNFIIKVVQKKTLVMKTPKCISGTGSLERDCIKVALDFAWWAIWIALIFGAKQ